MRIARQGVRGAIKRAEDKVGGPARLKVVLLLAAILALDTADKATVSAVADGLKQAFHISNTEIGILIAAVSFTGAALTLPIGSLIDRVSRKRVLLVTISLWAIAMLTSGFATSFTFLLVTRIVLGAVTASATPAVASLTGDFFPPDERAGIYSLVLAGELVGTGAGFFLSGEVSSLIDWHWSFFLMAAPSAALVWAIWRYLPEPSRGGESWISVGAEDAPTEQHGRPADNGGNDGGQSPSAEAQKVQGAVRAAGIEPREALVLDRDPRERSIWWVVGYLLRIPTYRLLVIASSLGYYFFAGIRSFAMIYLTEHYGLSRATLSALVFVIGIGALVGVLSGGRLSRILLDRGWPQARIVVPGVALFVAVLFFGPGIWTTDPVLGIALLTIGTGALAAANPPLDAARLDIVHPFLWGRGESGRMALRALLEGGAPVLFGLVSGWLGGGENGLKWTYLLMLIPALVASALAVPAYRSYPRDVATAAASVERLHSRLQR